MSWGLGVALDGASAGTQREQAHGHELTDGWRIQAAAARGGRKFC